jgi:hypothetical protein
MKTVILMGLMTIAVAVNGQTNSRLGFTGDGNEAMVDSLGLGRWYAVEGNYIRDSLSDGTWFQGPNSLRPDRLLPSTGTRVIREVAKLDARADGDPNYIPPQLVTDAITAFASRAVGHHSNPTADPIHSLRMPSPDPASLYASEAELIAKRIAADRAQATPAWPDTVYWEIGNEPNLSPWIKPTVYADIYNRYHQGIKSQSPEAMVGVSIHDNDIIQYELNYFIERTIEDSTEKRLSDTLSSDRVRALVAAGLIVSTAVSGVGFVTLLGGYLLLGDAVDDAERDTRNAVSRMFQQYTDNWDDYALKSTRLYFRSVLQALPDNSAPDFIGLHTYPIDVVKKMGLAAMQDDIDELVTGLQLEWVARFAPGDLARLQALVNANVRADLTAQDVSSTMGVRKVPPVLITEFGNISPEKLLIEEIKDTLYIHVKKPMESVPPDTLDAVLDGSVLSLCTGIDYDRDGVQRYDSQTDYGEITLMEVINQYGHSERYGTVSSLYRLAMAIKRSNYNISQNCSITKYKSYEFNSSFAKDLTLSMIDRFDLNPNIHAYLLFEPENADPKFASFGLTPAYSRLFNDVSTTVWGNIVAKNPCYDLNELGQELFVRETGAPCGGAVAKRAFASFTQPVWSSEALVEPSTAVRSTATAQALWVGGSGYRTLTQTFTASAVRDAVPGTYLGVDIFIPNAQKNPWWVGDAQLFWSAPSANVYNQYLGRADLTQLPRGNYSTISFALPGTAQNLMANLPGDASFTLAINGDGGFALDNFRFMEAQPAPFPTVRATERILAMDNVDDWSSEGSVLQAIADRPGVARPVLHIAANGWTRIASAEFDQSVIQDHNTLQVDVLVPDGGNAYWAGDLSASLDCPAMGVYSAWLGRVSFQELGKGTWQAVEIAVPAAARQQVSPAVGCRIFFDLNGNGTAKDYQLDQLRFVNKDPV